MKKIYLFFTLLCLLATSNTHYAFSFKKTLKTIFFMNSSAQETIEKIYPITAGGHVNVKNINGDVHVSTWSKQNVQIKMVKMAAEKEQLPAINIQIKEGKNKLDIVATCTNKNCKNPRVNFYITIPDNVSFTIATDIGNIIIEKATGKAHLTTNRGNITVKHANSTLSANVLSEGNINIDSAYSTCTATTARGKIAMHNTRESVHAAANQGSIHLQTAAIPPTSTVYLENKKGDIVVTTPATTNARVALHAGKGGITSEIPLKLDSKTMPLNKNSWRNAQKNISATIGDGTAAFNITAERGNIRLLSLKKTDEKNKKKSRSWWWS